MQVKVQSRKKKDHGPTVNSVLKNKTPLTNQLFCHWGNSCEESETDAYLNVGRN